MPVSVTATGGTFHHSIHAARWPADTNVTRVSEPIADRLDALQTAGKSTRWHVTASRWQVAREVAAANYLLAGLGHERYLPPIGGWSVDYSVAAAVLDVVRHHGQPVHMLELGSGAGTPWFASMAKQTGGHLVSVEHNLEFVARTSALLEHYNLHEVATVVHAELTSIDGGTPWYDLSSIESAVGERLVDVLIVDGPPGDIGPHPRRPALFALARLLTDGALVVLDDTVREDEKRTLADWEQAFGERLQSIPLLEHSALFRLRADTARGLGPGSDGTQREDENHLTEDET